MLKYWFSYSAVVLITIYTYIHIYVCMPEFYSGTLTDWAIRPWVQFALIYKYICIYIYVIYNIYNIIWYIYNVIYIIYIYNLYIYIYNLYIYILHIIQLALLKINHDNHLKQHSLWLIHWESNLIIWFSQQNNFTYCIKW